MINSNRIDINRVLDELKKIRIIPAYFRRFCEVVLFVFLAEYLVEFLQMFFDFLFMTHRYPNG